MDYLRLIIDLISVLVGYGVIGYVGMLLDKHHKAKHLANGLILAQKFMNMSVARVATDSSLPMGMRRKAAVMEVQEVLERKGYHFDIKRLIGLAQLVYNAYKEAGHKVVKPQPVPAPTVDNTTDAPKPEAKSEPKAKETNPVSNLSNDELALLNDYRKKKAANK